MRVGESYERGTPALTPQPVRTMAVSCFLMRRFCCALVRRGGKHVGVSSCEGCSSVLSIENGPEIATFFSLPYPGALHSLFLACLCCTLFAWPGYVADQPSQRQSVSL